ncbi:hypothetical protein FGRMN_6078 [Fusarium graminum]|nr:hypothetical protein FGRMN_6078 [Fusarium graminum]
MFDVIWTDPDRELAGEHRAKKEKKREQKNKEKERDQENSIIARSASATSTRSSAESRFNFLRPRNGKQAKNRDKTPSGLLTPSHNSSRSNSGSYHRSALMANLSDVSLGAARAQRAVTPASADVSQVYPPPGSVTFAIKRREASQTSTRPDSDSPDMSLDMRISSEAGTEPPATPERNLSVPIFQNDSSCSLVLSIKLSKQPKAPVVINFRPNDPDSWRPPEEWEYLDRQAEKEENAKTEEDAQMVLQTNDQVQPTCSDLEKLKDQVKFMATASPTMILTRIKQIWSVTDESLHTELNTELKRWMLSILNHLDIEPMASVTDGSALIDEPVGLKVLALYEPQALVTASYLVALHPMTTVYHVATEASSNVHFSNIQPVLVPSMSTSNSSLDQHLFEIVHSLSLPVVCSSPDIPQVLKQISKCLRVGGSLQLTLIDPLPCAGTLGYRMRTWLEENLLINLERNFRCTNPSKLFPDWMGDAGLRGQGSTLTTSKFYAVSASIRSQDDDDDPFIDREHSEREVKAEVRSIIGRLLWMEVWGNFVTGDKWWWEDEGCVNECVQLGTVWEYHIIEGIKQDDFTDEVEDLRNLEDQTSERKKA